MTLPGLQALQEDAYKAVCRAFYAQEALRWEQEDVLTKLRDFWNISNQMHSTITSEMRSDPDVVAVRQGGMPSRLGRAKGVAAPAPSLGPTQQPSFAQHPAGNSTQQQPPAQPPAGPGSQPAPAPPHFTEPSPQPAPPRRRQASLPAVVEHSSSSAEVSLYSEGVSERSSRQKQRGKPPRPKQKGGGGGGAKTRPGSLGGAPSMRRPSVPSARPAGAPGGGLQRLGSSMQRSRSTRQGGYAGVADPLGYVGRRLWRYWPLESPPWVEGFIQQWDADTDGYVIVYDPNTRESTEEVFNFATAVEGTDYVVGEYVDMTQVHGSRRQAEKPYVSPEALAAPPPAGLLATLPTAPSKKRKSTSGAPVPQDAPFEPTYLHARLPVAAEDELHQMLAVLERKERVVEAEINLLEYQEANREDIEARAALERRFQELCDREAALMAEMAALREAGAV